MQSTMRSQFSKAIKGKLLKQAVSAFFPAFHFSLEILSRRDSSLIFLTLLQLSHDWGRYKEKGSVSFLQYSFSILHIVLQMYERSGHP